MYHGFQRHLEVPLNGYSSSRSWGMAPARWITVSLLGKMAVTSVHRLISQLRCPMGLVLRSLARCAFEKDMWASSSGSAFSRWPRVLAPWGGSDRPGCGIELWRVKDAKFRRPGPRLPVHLAVAGSLGQPAAESSRRGLPQ